MDHQGRRYSNGVYGTTASNSGQGYGYGSGQAYSNGGPHAYSNSRKTLGPSYSGLPYLPSLQRCVTTLEMSTQLLKSAVAELDEATSGYPRLKTITSNTKQFELVSEQDIADAQVGVAKDVEPQLFNLTEKAVQIVMDLEGEEYQLIEKVHQETEKQKLRVQRQKAAKSGISNIKTLQSLTRRKEELSRSASELDEVTEQMRKEFSKLVERVNSQETRSGSKRLKRNPNNEIRELNFREEDRRKEITRQSQELEAIQQKIEDKRRSIRELRSKAESQNSSSSSGQGAFNPTLSWTMYTRHHNFLEGALRAEISVDSRDKGAYEDAFERVVATYLRELESRQAKTDKELNKLTIDKTRKLSQMRTLCKQLFPGDSIGQTMVRVLELLVESPTSEIYHTDLVQSDFPPDQERRHNLSRVVTILKQVGIIELVLETREDHSNEDDQEGDPGRSEEQLVLRIKFEDSN
ncbi:Spc19-domain-containing protein [Dissophora ornata]|nr:hypothetical protein BGZ58_008676 [Dissophora ornata]KAI8602524.1 Spc19-domain-containing protein [Dissophora ornata]